MKSALASSFTKIESAYLNKVRLFFCLRGCACGLYIGEADCFFVLPDGTQEASAASLLGITAAQGRSRLGNPPCLGYNLPFHSEAPFNGA